MHEDMHINQACSVKRVLTSSAKSIDSGQPAHSAQADLGRNFLPQSFSSLSKDHNT